MTGQADRLDNRGIFSLTKYLTSQMRKSRHGPDTKMSFGQLYGFKVKLIRYCGELC